MKIGFIGAGKVGTSLGRYLKDRSAEVTGYYSRSPESAHFAAEFTQTKAFSSLEDIVSVSDTLFLTVPDGAVSLVWSEVKEMPITGKIICHCSGALSSSVFSEDGQDDIFGYSIHPLFAVRSKQESYKELSKAFFTIEGHPRFIGQLHTFFHNLGNEVQIIETDQKVKYHAGAVFASNFAAAILQTGYQLFEECGFGREQAREILMPLFLNNALGISADGMTEALTGPVERNDAETVEKHLEHLNGEEKQLYILLSKKLVTLAEEKHKGRDYKNLLELLGREEEKGL